MDRGQKDTASILNEVEKRINKEFEQAMDDIEVKLEDYMRRYEIKDKTWRRWVEEGKKTQEEYNQWRIGQLAVGKRWNQQKDSIARELAHTSEIARQISQKAAPYIFGDNDAFATYEIEKQTHVDTSFTLYSRDTFARLVSEDPDVLPAPGKKVAQDILNGKAVRWNKQKLQSVMIQGLLQGESIPDLATRLARTVGDSDRKAAIRNARTMATGAQNAGRVNAYKRAQDKGVDLEQMWLATLDNRTRHSHRWLDREVRPVGEAFSNGCEYPGDPKGDPSEIYNCRCSLRGVVKGLERRAQKYRDYSQIDGMSYEEWRNAKAKNNPITLPEEKAKAIKEAYIREYGGYGSEKNTPKVELFDSIKLKNALGVDYNGFRENIEKSDVKNLYTNFADQANKYVLKKNGGSYRPATKTIEYSFYKHEVYPDINKFSTLAHECGHMFDDLIGRVTGLTYNEADLINEKCKIGSGAVKTVKVCASSCDEFLNALRKDMENLRPMIKDKSVKTEITAKNATMGVQDALDGYYSASKKGLVRWGHGERYYNSQYNQKIKSFGREKALKEAYQELGIDAKSQIAIKQNYRIYETASEAWANVNSALTNGGEELEAVTKYMPNTVEAYKRITRGL